MLEQYKKILTIAAHPDDEILGPGGTVNRLSASAEVNALILATGIASRDCISNSDNAPPAHITL